MCLHKLLFFTPPFLSGRGLGGWSDPLSRRSSESQQESRGRRPLAGASGEQRGATPLAGGMEDVPP